ncbi:Cytochrome c551 peroxidase [hydrothermal vent metagenome]|uniref:Cytochrome c551 peroxidase n=1 Tax=hydrothermal vent metagenome TaxID=652676 RepID=A0A3B1DQW8_9ZZZZ
MLVTHRYRFSIVSCLALGMFVGCSSEASVPSKTGKKDGAGSQVVCLPPENNAPSPAPLPTKVTLGAPSLTAGIPGSGKLSVEQINAWLSTPGVHKVLEITLPKGINLAKAQITGLKENPLTRAKIELGRQLYFDTRLSADNTISCSSCHDHEEGFARHTQFGIGINGQTGDRNTPISYNRILSGAQFWDGRAASLEAQAVGPIASPIEMGNTHEAVVKTIADIQGYKIQFEAIFGKKGVNIDNVGKALASFERTIVTGPSPYDYYADLEKFLNIYPTKEKIAEFKEDEPEDYVLYEKAKKESEAHPISKSAIRGKKLFFTEKANCTACHVGANFTDEKYHNLGIGMDKKKPDVGRFAVSKKEEDTGAFKTPTVRNVEFSAPYMHDGTLKTLEDVVEWYAKGGGANKHLSKKMKKLELTKQDKADLVAFMKACTGNFPKIETERLPE